MQCVYARSPRIRRASWISFGMMVTLFAWMAHKLVSSNKTYKVGFRSFLQCHDGRALESKIGLKVLCNFSDQALKRQLADQKFSRLLVSSDFTKSYSTRSVSVRFLNSASCWSAFPCSFSCKLFSWSFSTS